MVIGYMYITIKQVVRENTLFRLNISFNTVDYLFYNYLTLAKKFLNFSLFLSNFAFT